MKQRVGSHEQQKTEQLNAARSLTEDVHVSVVLCTYAEDMYPHFSEAAESILSQTYDDVELVVIVDGTQSVYDRVVANYGDRDDVIIECNEENVGLLESRNRGGEIATGDVVAFIDDDAVADEEWIERLVQAYKKEDVIAAGGKMTPEWVAGKPSFLPEEFYWLVGVTHRGFAEGPGEVRNTFGSNISFRAEVFEELGGFDVDIGGRKGEKNLQGGETELCARMRAEYGQSVWYDPEAKVAHKVFEYRTEFQWLVDRAFWQGYSKRAMESFVSNDEGTESAFLRALVADFAPTRVIDIVRHPSVSKISQFLSLFLFTAVVGFGYAYALRDWDDDTLFP